MHHCRSTVFEDTSYDNIGTPGKLAPANMPSIAGTPAIGGKPATARMKATTKKPTTPGIRKINLPTP
jgi:hypothetical protein